MGVLFWGARAVLVNLDERTVDHHHVKPELGCQRCKNGVKDAATNPSVEPLIHRTPLAELRREVPPGSAGTGAPEDTLNGGAVILDVWPALAVFVRQ